MPSRSWFSYRLENLQVYISELFNLCFLKAWCNLDNPTSSKIIELDLENQWFGTNFCPKIASRNILYLLFSKQLILFYCKVDFWYLYDLKKTQENYGTIQLETFVLILQLTRIYQELATKEVAKWLQNNKSYSFLISPPFTK